MMKTGGQHDGNSTSLWPPDSSQDQEKKMVKIKATELKIIWSSDARFWIFPEEEINGQQVKVAELLKVCWLQISGSYPCRDMTSGRNYEVKFIVKLKQNLKINSPVYFTLTPPDGIKRECQEHLMKMPRDQLIGITVGEFPVSEVNAPGKIQFSMLSTYPAWKRGLVVIGVLIAPKN